MFKKFEYEAIHERREPEKFVCLLNYFSKNKDFLTKNEHKDQYKTIFEHMHIHAFVKSTMAERTELPRVSGRYPNR